MNSMLETLETLKTNNSSQTRLKDDMFQAYVGVGLTLVV